MKACANPLTGLKPSAYDFRQEQAIAPETQTCDAVGIRRFDEDVHGDGVSHYRKRIPLLEARIDIPSWFKFVQQGQLDLIDVARPRFGPAPDPFSGSGSCRE